MSQNIFHFYLWILMPEYSDIFKIIIHRVCWTLIMYVKESIPQWLQWCIHLGKMTKINFTMHRDYKTCNSKEAQDLQSFTNNSTMNCRKGI